MFDEPGRPFSQVMQDRHSGIPQTTTIKGMKKRPNLSPQSPHHWCKIDESEIKDPYFQDEKEPREFP